MDRLGAITNGVGISWLKIVSGIVVVSLLASCGPLFKIRTSKKTKSTTFSTPAPTAEDRALRKCPTRNDQSLDPARVVQRNTIEIGVSRQYVIRKNCDGSVKSAGIERVTQSEKIYLIKPVANIWNAHGTAHNRSTCDDDAKSIFADIRDAFNPLRGMGPASLRVDLNTSPAINSMHVRKNTDNYIDYEFRKCLEKDAARTDLVGQCVKWESVERGTLILTVKYNEDKLIPGERTYQETCPEPKTP